MNILCINTAFSVANLALESEGKVILKELNEKHSEACLPALELMLDEMGLKIQDIDVVGVNVGPGSFTGIRVALALIKGFSVACPKLKCVQTNSFELMAKAFGNGSFTTVLNALSGKFYTAKFADGEMQGTPELKNIVEDKVLVGLKQENLNFVTHNVEISTQAFYEICKEKVLKNEFVSSGVLEPMYLRKSQAEENLQGVRLEKLTQRHLADVYEISKEEFGSSSWSLQLFEQELIENNRFSYVITDNGRAVSFINVLECEGEQGKEFNILNIASKEKHQGYATKLLQEVLNKAKVEGIVNVWLEVDAKNVPALNLYEKLGFKKIAVRKKYYKNGSDALILRREI